jgi:hypothetical protein
MKIINKIFLFISILGFLSLGLTTTVSASAPESMNFSDGIIVGDYTLKSGETNQGDLVIFGGEINIEKESKIYGSLAVIGGKVDFDGEITGDVVCIGGSCNIGDSATITGSLVVVGSGMELSEEAVIIGEHVFIGNDSLEIPAVVISPDGNFTPSDPPIIPSVPENPIVPDYPNITIDNNPGWDFLQNLFSTTFMILAVSAMALLVGVLFPNHLKKTAKTIVNEPVKSGVLGLLTITVAPFVILLLAITIILLPVSLILAFAITVLVFYGWVAVGYELGVRIAKAMNGHWDVSIQAGIGTMALSIMAAIINMIPCVGFLFYPIVFFIGLGGVFISQFGHREIKSAEVGITPALPEELVSFENIEGKDITDQD